MTAGWISSAAFAGSAAVESISTQIGQRLPVVGVDHDDRRVALAVAAEVVDRHGAGRAHVGGGVDARHLEQDRRAGAEAVGGVVGVGVDVGAERVGRHRRGLEVDAPPGRAVAVGDRVVVVGERQQAERVAGLAMKSQLAARLRSIGCGAQPGVSRCRSRARPVPATQTRSCRPVQEATESRADAPSLTFTDLDACGRSRTRLDLPIFAHAGVVERVRLELDPHPAALPPVVLDLGLEAVVQDRAWDCVSLRGLISAVAVATGARTTAHTSPMTIPALTAATLPRARRRARGCERRARSARAT